MVFLVNAALSLSSLARPKGKAQIKNVEFFRSGQEGWTDYFDPRYSVTFLNLGEVGQHSARKETSAADEMTVSFPLIHEEPLKPPALFFPFCSCEL